MSWPGRDPEDRRGEDRRRAAGVLAIAFIWLARGTDHSPWAAVAMVAVAVVLVRCIDKARGAPATRRRADRPARLNPLWDRELDGPG